MDSYQPIYDAVRSRISGCDVGSIVEDAARNAFDWSYARALLQEQIGMVGNEHVRPSVLFRPSLSPDGNKWCALFGDDLVVGVAGFGDTPEEAMREFDRAWWALKPPVIARAEREPSP